MQICNCLQNNSEDKSNNWVFSFWSKVANYAFNADYEMCKEYLLSQCLYNHCKCIYGAWKLRQSNICKKHYERFQYNFNYSKRNDNGVL